MYGELHNVPICLGSTQKGEGLYNANFKISAGEGYNIILGLDLLDKVDAIIKVRTKVMTFAGNPKLGGGTHSVALLTRTQVRAQPTVLKTIQRSRKAKAAKAQRPKVQANEITTLARSLNAAIVEEPSINDDAKAYLGELQTFVQHVQQNVSNSSDIPLLRELDERSSAQHDPTRCGVDAATTTPTAPCDPQTIYHLCNTRLETDYQNIQVKPKKGAKIDPETVRQKLRAKGNCRVVIDGPCSIGVSSAL